MSFAKRLALFFLILAVMILFIGLFPVIAQSAPLNGNVSFESSFIMLQSQNASEAIALSNLFPKCLPENADFYDADRRLQGQQGVFDEAQIYLPA